MEKTRKFPIFFGSRSTDGVLGLASPVDRVAASILDVILLLPLVQLFQAPVKRWILESLLFFEGTNSSFYRFTNLFIFIIVFVLYDSLMTYFKGQTVGKMFFNIKVISYNGNLDFISCFLRSFSIFIEMVLVGLPFLAMHSHPMRRPIHDRVADSLVISLKNPVGFPEKRENIQSRLLFFGALALLFLSIVTYWIMEDGLTSNDSYALEKNCRELNRNYQGDVEAFVESYLAGRISEECLFDEARAHIWQNKNQAVAQFAVALALQYDTDLSDKYLNKICEKQPGHYLCDFSRWLTLNADAESFDMTELNRIIKHPEVHDFTLVFASAFYFKMGDYRKMEEISYSIRRKELLSPVVATLVFKSLLGQLRYEEAKLVYSSNSSLSEIHLLEFSLHQLQAQLTTPEEQAEMLRFFYPELAAPSGRGLASESYNPTSKLLKEFYHELVEEQ